MEYDVQRFKDLIEETVQCCQTRTAFLAKKFDIPQAELRCMMLFQGERYLTVKGIAQKLDIAKSRVSKLVDGLVQRKLADRVDDPRDARVKLIALTQEGLKKAKEVDAFANGLHEQILLQMAPEERKSVLSALESLRSSMEAVKKQLK